MRKFLFLLLALIATPLHAEDWQKRAAERDVRLPGFRFGTGETMDLRMHVTTLGTPRRNAAGEIDNAVMVLHGTGGSGYQFFRPQFADELYGPGQPLDITKWYVILPDSIGHGKSSKPSDGLRMAFPRYGYLDMVAAQRRMLVEGLGVKQLQLILGTSMGCMHGFVWGTEYPGFARRLAPFACNTMEIAGRNRMWRQMSIDAIKADPLWNGGNYTQQPESGLRTARYLSMIAGGNPVALQAQYPTREGAVKYLNEAYAARAASDLDANDQIYQLDSSRDYNPLPKLRQVTVPVLWINSADDFINPPELGLAQKHAKLMPRARFILIPASPETKGHGTHTWAKFWKKDLAKLLATK
ncbi:MULTISPECIES: alpha/beta fold hydrolase [unclassified Novosphingobium]|uniref:alpha/beta fold hydrolase n=1 Tax=unclassified Novosphingobium TaxID=2644732 RepID=UPI0025EAC345|nr:MULTISPECIES: alpha/beta fold hydrolase [unclassified Novosphingobium]HQV02665.1 alpha/beta fold hydrolase [Novosphingobium sp.]